MDRPVQEVKGIGAERKKALEGVGIVTVYDLLHHFPRRHIDRSIVNSTAFQIGRVITLIAHIETKYLAHGRRSRLIVQCRTLAGESIQLIWFNAAKYLLGLFEKGRTVVVSGKLESRGGMQMVHPDFEFMDEEDENALLHVGRIVPIYPSTESLKRSGLDSRGFRRIIASALEIGNLRIPEILPEAVLRKYSFPSRAEALRAVHFPEGEGALRIALHRLKYEELFLLNALMYRKAEQRKVVPRVDRPLRFESSDIYQRLVRSLPFQPTNDQITATREILALAENDHSYSVLLQGDVGSGKTLVALSVILHYAERGIQSAVMAPTEILARQHYATFLNYIGILPNFRIELLTGQDSKKGRATVLESLANGDTLCVIGTHTLIEESVLFRDLGLVIIDEQHRFGVNQREALRAKGRNPDLIAMTATPIPRTLCLTEFADLQAITLKEKPAGRKPVKTMWLREERRSGLYKSIRNHVGAGRQCFIVYPVVDESKRELKPAVDAFEELKVLFPEFRVELLHGKMKAPDRERVMNDFRANRVQILATTTVVEVGVDVPNATIMVIEHADRFGISQLHQLRGRVGRGSEESFCILMADDITEEAAERLKAIESSEDGFYLSEVDLRIRGPGELLGTKQHGISGLRLANLITDRDLAEQCYRDVHEWPDVNEEAIRAIKRQFEEGAELFPS
jgi:ATP-dependent DNA helicase RecG